MNDQRISSATLFNSLYFFCKRDVKTKGRFFQMLVYGNNFSHQLPDSLYKSFAEGKDYQVAIPEKYKMEVLNTAEDTLIIKYIISSTPNFSIEGFIKRLSTFDAEAPEVEKLSTLSKQDIVQFWLLIRKLIFIPEYLGKKSVEKKGISSMSDYKCNIIEELDNNGFNNSFRDWLKKLLSGAGFKWEKDELETRLGLRSDETNEDLITLNSMVIDWLVYSKTVIKNSILSVCSDLEIEAFKALISSVEYSGERKDCISKYQKLINSVRNVADLIFNTIYFLFTEDVFDIVIEGVDQNDIFSFDGFKPEKSITWEEASEFLAFQQAYGINTNIGKRELFNARYGENPLLVYEYGISLYFNHKPESLKFLLNAAKNGSNNAIWDLAYFIQSCGGDFKYVGKSIAPPKDVQYFKNMYIATILFVEAAKMGMAQAFNSLANNVGFIENARTDRGRLITEIRVNDKEFLYPLLSKSIYEIIFGFAYSITKNRDDIQDSDHLKRVLYQMAVKKGNKNAKFNLSALNLKRVKSVLMPKYLKTKAQNLSTKSIKDEMRYLVMESLNYLEESGLGGLSESARAYALLVGKNMIRLRNEENTKTEQVVLFEDSSDIKKVLGFEFDELKGKCKNILLNILTSNSSLLTGGSYIRECELLYQELFNENIYANSLGYIREAVPDDAKDLDSLYSQLDYYRTGNSENNNNSETWQNEIVKMLHSESQYLIVYEKDNHVVASVSYHICTGMCPFMVIGNKVIDEKYKNEGYLERLLDYCRNIAKNVGCIKIIEE